MLWWTSKTWTKLINPRQENLSSLRWAAEIWAAHAAGICDLLESVKQVSGSRRQLVRTLVQGLDSDQPKLTLLNGVTFTGAYEQTIGTDLLLSIHDHPHAPKSLSYMCHTENRLKFLRSTRVPHQGQP